MRKLFALLIAAVSLSLAACEKKSETTSETADTVSVPTEVPAEDPGVQPMAPDSVSADSAVAK